MLRTEDYKDKIIRKENYWKRMFYNRHYYKTIKEFVSNSKNHLDYGCGFGMLAFLLAKTQKNTKVKGFDKDLKAINLGKKTYSQKNLELSNVLPKKEFDSLSLHGLCRNRLVCYCDC
ncbi:MAG: class I SAM-dependent methyltransferase [archaeon]